MCWQITVLLFAITVAHMWPKESHYRYFGKCAPNSTVEWEPEPNSRRGMIYLRFRGNGSVFWEHSEMRIEGNVFAHTYGELPRIDYKAQSLPLKVTAHLIT